MSRYIAGAEAWKPTEQLQQIEQSLQVQQARVAMPVLGLLPVAGRCNALVEARDLRAQLRFQILGCRWVVVDQRGKPLGSIRLKVAIMERCCELTHHQFGHLARALLVPLQADLKRRAQPPADPLHWPLQFEPLGQCQTPWTTRVGGIDQDRTSCRDAGLNSGVQPFFHLMPVALDHRVAVELLTDPIRGEELRIQQRCQQLRNGALPARRRSDQEVAAQGGGHEHS